MYTFINLAKVELLILINNNNEILIKDIILQASLNIVENIKRLVFNRWKKIKN